MRWRLSLALAVVGIGLIVWGVMEWRLGSGASAQPERMTLKQLIARGPEGNPNILLTDFELGDNYVISEDTKTHRWNGVYIPAFPPGEGKAGVGPGRPVASIKAVIFSLNVHSDADIQTVIARRELPALVTNRIKSLGSEEKRLLQNQYGGGINVDACLIIQEGRKPMSGAILALMFGGGAILLLGALGFFVFSMLSGEPKAVSVKRKRRRKDDEDEDDRPRKKRRSDDDDDEPRAKRRRSRDEEDEDDAPRPKRRRPRDEDDE